MRSDGDRENDAFSIQRQWHETSHKLATIVGL